MFYQSFLFDACVGYATLNSEGLKGETCKITTQDYQTYYVNLATGGKIWSDGVPMTLDDVHGGIGSILLSGVGETQNGLHSRFTHLV